MHALCGIILILFSKSAFAADLEPITKVKVSNQGETSVVDVRSDIDAYKRFTVDAFVTNSLPVSILSYAANILKQAEISVATKAESDLTGTTYTVAAGKSFRLMTFGGSYDTQSPMYLRLKKQTACTGSFVTQFRISLKQQGQDESNYQVNMPTGLTLGEAGDCFKITYQSALSKGTLWSGFTGTEY